MEYFGTKVKMFLQDKNKKPFHRILAEMTELWIRNRCLPRHYITRFLYRKGHDQYRDFVSQREVVAVKKAFQSETGRGLMMNKLSFHYYCEANGLPTPKLLAYSFRKHMFFNKETVFIESCQALQKVLINVIESNDNKPIFLKPITGGKGRQCFKLSHSTLQEAEFTSNLFKIMVVGDFIIQDTLDQHPEVNRIFLHSVNTVRIHTFATDGSVEIMSALMRFGSGENYVDNGSLGGCFALIDLESGQLADKAHTYLEHGGVVFSAHPTTGVTFSNTKVPFFEQVKVLAVKAAHCFPDRLIGWDIAITPTGPVLIEGNQGFCLGGIDFLYGGLKRNPIFRKVLDSIRDM